MAVTVSMPEGVAQEVEEQMYALDYELTGTGCGSTEFRHETATALEAEGHVAEIINKLKSRITVMRDECQDSTHSPDCSGGCQERPEERRY